VGGRGGKPYYEPYSSARSIAPQQNIRLTNRFVRFHSERAGRLGVPVVTTRSVPASLPPLLVTLSVTPSSAGGNGDETDNGVSIQQSSVAGGNNVATHDSAHNGESVETGNSSDATKENPISGASPEEFSRMAVLGNDEPLLSCTSKLWTSLHSNGFIIFDSLSSKAGNIKFGIDFHLTSVDASEFPREFILGNDMDLL